MERCAGMDDMKQDTTLAEMTDEQLEEVIDEFSTWTSEGYAIVGSERLRFALFLQSCVASSSATTTPNDIEQYVISVLPSVYYMDPPDGGSVTVLEQLRRMVDDASKYRTMVAGEQPK